MQHLYAVNTSTETEEALTYVVASDATAAIREAGGIGAMKLGEVEGGNLVRGETVICPVANFQPLDSDSDEVADFAVPRFYRFDMYEGCCDAVYVQAWDWMEAENLVRELPPEFGDAGDVEETEETCTFTENAAECDFPVFTNGYFARLGDERMAEVEARKK